MFINLEVEVSRTFAGAMWVPGSELRPPGSAERPLSADVHQWPKVIPCKLGGVEIETTY